jgi:hypothetical protein
MTKDVRNNKGGSLPLAAKVAATRQRFSATPSVIGTQLRKAQMIALTAPLSIAATPLTWCSVEVEV